VRCGLNADGTDARQIETPGFAPSWWHAGHQTAPRSCSPPDHPRRRGDLDGRRRWIRSDENLGPTDDQIANEWAYPPNEVYVINADGSGLTLVFGGNDPKRRFDWSPQ
jgi:hypothetical protein